MTSEDIIAAAARQTGISDIGDRAVRAGLDILLQSYETEARFTVAGKRRQLDKLVANMAIRMRVEDWLGRHPEILDAPVEKPLFVFGLPRTGTTLLINLLHADPERRSLLHWEAREPVPPPSTEELRAGPRFDKWRDITARSLSAVPHIAAIHHEHAASPTECQFAMTPSFCAQVYEAESDIPTYRRWLLDDADYLPAFRFHKRLLQLLQSRAPGRWTLKNPWHPLFLDALTEVYPDAQLVMTHRDPAEVVGSCCSLIKYVRKLYSDDVDLKAIGESFIDTFKIMIERTIAYKDQHGHDSICDVQYADTLRNPMGEVARIYDHFGEALTPEAEAAMVAFMRDNPQDKFGKHVYNLEEYGLTKDRVRREFKDYIERFDIPLKD